MYHLRHTNFLVRNERRDFDQDNYPGSPSLGLEQITSSYLRFTVDTEMKDT